MTELDLNFGGVEASSGFDPLPEGTYLARVDGIEVKDTKPKDGVTQTTSDGQQARYLNVTYKILDEDYQGRLVWGINSIRFPANPLDDTDKERTTREMFVSWLNTVTGTDWADTEQKLNLNALVGSEVKIVVTQDTYDGKVNNKVKKVLDKDAAGGGGSNLDSLRKVI